MDLFGFCSPKPAGMEVRGVNQTVNGKDPSVANWMGCCDPQNPVAIAANINAAGSAQGGTKDRAGVGIILALNPDGSLFVHTVCKGSSAEGHLQPGDVLMKIGDEDVYRAPAPYVAEKLLGPPGSEVEMWVRRSGPGSGTGFTTHHAKMVRRRTDPTLARQAIQQAFEEHSNAV
mmetsp:Transcript_2961/g.4814  ORF Transcript_2961/g.4814 Transcript_2961/m.4814 type:complete len:174 (+) Transcript_2961:285-806(+)